MKLKQLADITMGHSFRSRLERTEGGNLSVIQMKDLTEDNRLDIDGLTQVDLEELKPHQYVQPDDIVFRSRGQTNTAVLVTGDVGEAVVAAPLLRIRAGETVLPGYLTWFLNLPKTQGWLTSQAKGTAVRMISKQALADMPIVVPSIARQEEIIQLAGLAADEQRLMQALAATRKQYIEGILMRAASEAQSA